MSINNSVVVSFHCPYDFIKNRFHPTPEPPRSQRIKAMVAFQFSKVQFKFIGPFLHSAILLGDTRETNAGEYDTYYSMSITKNTNNKIACKRREFSDPGYSFWRIDATKKQQQEVSRIANFINLGDISLSYWKLYGFNRFTNDLSFRTDIEQKTWMCSELTMFLLQEAEIIPNKENPKTFTPTGIYEYLRKNKIGQPTTLYNNQNDVVRTYDRYREIV